jgi:hypothetical protein
MSFFSLEASAVRRKKLKDPLNPASGCCIVTR